MASGRPNGSGNKGFNFASDDILCSYEDYHNQDGSNGGSHSDPAIGTDSSKEFNKTRMSRSGSMFSSTPYNPQEESSLNQDMISTIDKSMKKHTDNLMRFLEGISSRLSDLELFCYNLDKSIGEMRTELNQDRGVVDTKLITIANSLQEVHRSVQILRDKQELADTQKELAKLHILQKEPSNSEKVATIPDTKKSDNTSSDSQQLALAPPPPQPPLQGTPQPSRPAEQPPMGPAPPMGPTSQGYYLPPVQTQVPQGQYLHPNNNTNQGQYQNQTSQIQDPSVMGPVPPPSQYQQQWGPQVGQQVKPSSSNVYPSYVGPHIQSNPPPQEIITNSSSMPMPYYGGPIRTSQPQSQPPPQHLKPEGYTHSGSPGNNYMIYDEGRPQPPHQSPHQPPPQMPHQMPPQQFSQGNNYGPRPNSSMMNNRPPQYVRNSPYNELIEKLVSMGFRGDHVISVIQRLEESGQTVDFNSVLDKLNGHSSGGGSQRGGWSG